jgi:hypothetical protein
MKTTLRLSILIIGLLISEPSIRGATVQTPTASPWDDDQNPGFKGLWRVKLIRASLVNNLDTLNMSPPTVLNRSVDSIVSVGEDSSLGLKCQIQRVTPDDQGILRRLSKGDKQDFARQELLQALKTCEQNDFKSVSEKFIKSLKEVKVACDQNPTPPGGDRGLNSLTYITMLSKKYALGHLNNEYICLERLPSLSPEPSELTSHKILVGQEKSPLGSQNEPMTPIKSPIKSPIDSEAKKPTKYSTLNPNTLLCPEPRFIEKHPDDSILTSYLNKSSLYGIDAVEAAFKTCKITLSNSPLKKIRLMRHFEVLCGDQLQIPPQDDKHLQWFSITPQNQLLVATAGQFFCFSKTKNLAH